MLDFNFTEEEIQMQELARKFARKELLPAAPLLDAHHDPELFQRLWRKSAEIGLLGALVPEEYGGAGASPLALFLMIEELAACDAGFAVSMGVTWAVQSLILTLGTPEQEERFLPRISSTRGVPAAGCLTEPVGGSDVESVKRCGPGSIRTTYRKVDGGYVINGTKNFITNGGVAGVYGVLATADVKKGSEASTMFLVSGDSKGLSVGRVEDKMGMRSSPTVQMVFEEVFVPDGGLFGEEGEGVEITEIVMIFTRGAVGSLSVGIARAAYEAALAYARERVQGGKPIIEHQGVGFMLADMAMMIEAGRTLAHKSGWMALQLDRDLEERFRISCMAKTFCSDMANQVASDAVQIFGGYGYMKDYPLERYMRDVKVTQIFEGPNQIQRQDILDRL